VPLTDIFQDEMKQFRPGVSLWTVFAGFARVFDIVNGFLIDAVAVSYQHVRLCCTGRAISSQINLYDYLAEIIPSASIPTQVLYRLVVDGADSQA